MEALAGKLGAAAMIVGLLLGVLAARLGARAECCISPPRSRYRQGLSDHGSDWSWVALFANSAHHRRRDPSGGWRRC
jgi:hypothetical protein